MPKKWVRMLWPIIFLAIFIANNSVMAQNILPPPEPRFKGEVGLTYKDSTPAKIPITTAPKGAPNVLLILIDDAGFGQCSTFGGAIPTPVLDRLAKQGLRYTSYHTTALCSPTRAALLTGRNHHSTATGCITELGTSFPGYTGAIPKSTALVCEILRQNGYSTAAFGKWHNTPDWETSVSGPFDRWPTGLGFDKFYGFMGGECNQWQPTLYEGITPVEMKVPPGQEKSYVLNDALADAAIDWIHQQKSVTPDKPFFVFWAPGATHAPHHVPQEWIDKFKGQFDQGWDKYREETFERQKQLGIIPANCVLTARPKQIPSWDSLKPDEKQVAARLMETFAGFTAQTDYEVGRIIDALAQMGQLNNTLVFYEIGDNGASGEGTVKGVFNEMTSLNGVPEGTSYVIKHIDEIGGPKAYNHYPVGWAWAMDTPFQWCKQVASHFGGTRNPLVVFYPDLIKDQGGIRTQFHHCIDIVPTILEVAHIPEPTEVNGVQQKPIEGCSIVYSFDSPTAESPRHTQYFEMFCNRALYHNGWIAACFHGRVPWETGENALVSFNNEKWELYNIANDFSEGKDLSQQFPNKTRELRDMFWVEAAKYNVLPLDDRIAERFNPSIRPSLIAGRTNFRYFQGADCIPESSAPNIKNKSFSVAADITVPLDGVVDGVVIAQGGTVGGWCLYVKAGKPIYDYNWFAMQHFIISGSNKLPPGPVELKFDFTYDGGGLGKGGIGKLYVNGEKVGEGRIDRTVPGRFSAEETFDTGKDLGSPVGNYASPFPFTGTVEQVKIDIDPKQLSTKEESQITEKVIQATQ